MRQQLASVTFLVSDYDEAIAYFTEKLRFGLVEDRRMDESGKRWVRVAPPGGGGTALLLARAATPEQKKCVGQQGGGRVFLFLQTDSIQRDFNAMRARGAAFLEEPRAEAYGNGRGVCGPVRQQVGFARIEKRLSLGRFHGQRRSREARQ